MQTNKTAIGARNTWIDSIRGIAVLIVCLSHLFYLPPIKNSIPEITKYIKGDIGVWMFYVLSGYLISTLLNKEKEKNGKIQLGKFYGRRFFRLAPSYILFVILAFIFASDTLKDSGLSVLSFIFPWLDMTSGIGYLPYHLRTLHIEEKFYILWSVLATLTISRFRIITAYVFLLYGPIARLMIYFGYFDTLMFDSAADCFALGILLSYSSGKISDWASKNKVFSHFLLSPSFLLFLMMAIGALRTITPFSFFLVPFLPTCVGILTCLFILSGWSRGTLLNSAWLAKLGLMSYTIYLFQQLVLCPWNNIYSIPFSWTLWTGCSLACIIGVVVWFHGVEAPFIRWSKKRFSHHS